MRSNSSTRVSRCAAALLALALAVPFFTGCSQLGIAKSDDLTAMESSLRNSNNATNTRIDALEKSTGDMQTTLAQITTSLDSLNTRFARAATWLETMSLDTISKDAKDATDAAKIAAANSQVFFQHYLEWIKGQHAALAQQITTLEAQVKAAPSGDAKKPAADDSGAKPADDGGGDS